LLLLTWIWIWHADRNLFSSLEHQGNSRWAEEWVLLATKWRRWNGTIFVNQGVHVVRASSKDSEAFNFRWKKRAKNTLISDHRETNKYGGCNLEDCILQWCSRRIYNRESSEMMHWRYCSSAKSDSFIKWSPTRMSSSVLAFFFNTCGWFSRLANAHSIALWIGQFQVVFQL